MKVNAQEPMASGPTPPTNEVYDQGFHVPAPTAVTEAIRPARRKASTAQAHPSMPEHNDHRLSAGKLRRNTSLAMPSEPGACKRRSGLIGTDANGGEKEKEPVQEPVTKTHDKGGAIAQIGN